MTAAGDSSAAPDTGAMQRKEVDARVFSRLRRMSVNGKGCGEIFLESIYLQHWDQFDRSCVEFSQICTILDARCEDTDLYRSNIS